MPNDRKTAVMGVTPLVSGIQKSRFEFLVEAFGLSFMDDGHASRLLTYMEDNTLVIIGSSFGVRYLALP